MDTAEHDIPASMNFPKEQRTKLHSGNPLERLNGEIKRRTNVVEIFPNEGAVTRLIGAIPAEQNDERECLHQTAPRGSLKNSALDAENRVKRKALTPRAGTRSRRFGVCISVFGRKGSAGTVLASGDRGLPIERSSCAPQFGADPQSVDVGLIGETTITLLARCFDQNAGSD